MQWNSLIQQVRYAGLYATAEEAERVLCAVLAILGRQVTQEVRGDLARALPAKAAATLTAEIPRTQALTATVFVEAVAERLAPFNPPEARWATGTVLTLVVQRAGKPLTRRLLTELPHDYALLFGQAQFAPFRATAA